MQIRLAVALCLSTCFVVTVATDGDDDTTGATISEDPPELERASLEIDPIQLPVPSKGCGNQFKFAATPGGESRRVKIGDTRAIRITLPVNYDHGTPAPLILAFHDKNMTSKDMETTTLLSSAAYNKEAIVVYPEAQMKDRWQSDAKPAPGANDQEFVNHILDKLEERLCIDTDRIYATGLGIGGGMVHLLACSRLSSRIAAFSLVNGNIFAKPNRGNRYVIQDPTHRVWEQCVAYRSIVRLQAIHSENNTVFDYWANNKYEGRRRKASVENLVDWANRNKCGEGVSQPEPWRHGKDAVHKTLLQQGYIFEGFIEEGAVIKATYHCWPADYGKLQQQDMELNEDGSMIDPPEMPKVHDPRTEEEKLADFMHRIHRNMIQEHYYVRNTGHGWHRVEKIRNEDDAKRKAEQQPLGYFQALPVWKQLPDAPDYDPDTKFDGSMHSTFDHGYLEPSELVDRPPRFDTTARVLQFFRSYRLSDPSPKAPRDADGLTEPEEYMVEMFAQQLIGTMDTDASNEAEDDGSLSVTSSKDGGDREIPIIDLGGFKKPAPDTIQRIKDEL